MFDPRWTQIVRFRFTPTKKLQTSRAWSMVPSRSLITIDYGEVDMTLQVDTQKLATIYRKAHVYGLSRSK